MEARRRPLAALGVTDRRVGNDKIRDIRAPQTAHAGLWYDKYLDQQFPQSSQSYVPYQTGLTPYQQLVRTVSEFELLPLYQAFFKRWEQSLTACGACLFTAKTRGRQVIGLGSAGVIENAITLHHTYGVPYLPGSALKGLAAHYARNYLDTPWQKGGEAYNNLFGSQKRAGVVTFHDALPSAYRFEPDILTVHHRGYYQQGETPADWDSPVPIPFLTVVSGVFYIPLAGPEAWVQAAATILNGALSELGIGAKTYSGYGRMRLEGADKPQNPPQPVTLQQGAVIPATVVRIGTENIHLQLDPTRFTNVAKAAEQLVFLTKPAEHAFEAGMELWCYVLSCEIDELFVYAECRPATTAEQRNQL